MGKQNAWHVMEPGFTLVGIVKEQVFVPIVEEMVLLHVLIVEEKVLLHVPIVMAMVLSLVPIVMVRVIILMNHVQNAVVQAIILGEKVLCM